MSNRPPPFATTDEVIQFIGADEVCRVTGASPKAVWNWTGKGKGRGRFPSDTYLPISRKLGALGREASPSLWGGFARVAIEDLPQVVSPAGA